MTVRIPLIQKSFLTLISGYAPTLTAEDEHKTAFYDQLTCTIFNVPGSDKLVVLGDFNARVGRDHHLRKGIIGHHSIGKCNANGELLLGLCAEQNLIVTNTLFQLPNRQKTTWKHPAPNSGTYSTISLQEQKTEETCISHDPCLEQMAVGRITASSSLDSISISADHLSTSRQTFPIADSTVISFVTLWHRNPSEKPLIRI